MNIKEMRKQAGLSQVNFAKIVGVSVATLRRWESGENKPSPLAEERLIYINKLIENDALGKLVEEAKINSDDEGGTCKTREFKFNGEKHSVEFMPYVYNGPTDQLSFYNELIDLQEQTKSRQEWKKYSKKLSIVKSVDEGQLTAQFLLEKPTPKSKSWGANSGANGWHRYVGRFPAQLIRAIINAFDLGADDTILDPFVGSGTTLVEARLLGVPSIGIEISPLSAMMSRVKSQFPNDPSKLLSVEKELEEFYKNKYQVFLAKFGNKYCHDDVLKRKGNEIKPFPNIEKWFTPNALLGTSIVVEFILKLSKTYRYGAEFVAIALSSKMRSIGNVDVDVVRAEYRKTPRENVDVLSLVTNQIKKMIRSIETMTFSHKGIVSDQNTVTVYEGSCLEQYIKSQSISAIITSPPYGVESLSYLRTHLLSFRALEPILGVDPYNFGEGVIGSEYIPEDEHSLPELSSLNESKTYNSFFGALLHDEEMEPLKTRVVMMMKFFCDINRLIKKFSDWLRPNGRVAFVIGNKKIGDKIIPTDKIVTELFEANGFIYKGRIAHKLKTNNSNSKVPWQDRIIENEFVIFYEKTGKR